MGIVRHANENIFRIQVGELDQSELRVLRLRGVEAISELFEFELELVSENAEISFEDVIGCDVSISIAGHQEERFINGVASRFEQGPVGQAFTRYFMHVVPRQWTLTHRIACRIFQEKTVPEIIEEVLSAAEIPSDTYRSTLQATYESREYCVQYNESDWAFVCRLMEEEGIFYFFEHDEEGQHTLVLGDDASAHDEISGESSTIPFRDPFGAVPEVEYIGHFRMSQSVAGGKYSARAYNFETPSTDLHTSDRGDAHDEYDHFEYPGGYLVESDGARLARVRREERQALRRVATGRGVCNRIVPGYRFSLDEYSRSDFNTEYLAVEIVHEGYEPQALEQEMPDNDTESEYNNEFRAIPADTPFRPARITPKPVINGVQSAVIVGPSGEEIYTDEYGRVKANFFWNTASEGDENSSAWIRVMQPTAGSGFGTMMIPRIGWEVLIAFQNGDPDEPYVTGCVYNAQQMPPYALPDHKTISTIKTASSPGAEGFNELRFEDEAGEEQIFLHAQKNMDTRIGEDLHEQIVRNYHRKVEQDQVHEVVNERHTKIGADDVSEITGDMHLKVSGKQAVEITGSKSLAVTGDVIEEFGGSHSESVSSDYYVTASNIVLEASTGLTIKCGSSAVVLDSSGVTIKGNLVTVDGQTVKIASGPGSSAGSGSAGTLVSPIAPNEVEDADEADPGQMEEVRAEQAESGTGRYGAVQLTPFQPEEDEDDDSETTFIEIELHDEDGNPIAGERYEIVLPDGQTAARGTLDENGFARVEGFEPGTCEVTFPDLDQDAWEPE